MVLLNIYNTLNINNIYDQEQFFGKYRLFECGCILIILTIKLQFYFDHDRIPRHRDHSSDFALASQDFRLGARDIFSTSRPPRRTVVCIRGSQPIGRFLVGYLYY